MTTNKSTVYPQQLQMDFTAVPTPMPESAWSVARTASPGETLEMLDAGDREMRVRIQRLTTMQTRSGVVRLFAETSKATGSLVIIDPQYNCLPLLQGKDGSLVFLYRFVETLEEKLDYDELKAEYPMLSYGQISGGIAFLRKLAQFNATGQDIDQLEDEIVEGTPDFQQIIVAASDKGPARVLNAK